MAGPEPPHMEIGDAIVLDFEALRISPVGDRLGTASSRTAAADLIRP